MAQNLFPVFDVPATLTEHETPKAQYYPAPLWDVEGGDFVLNGARQPLYGSGYEAWVLWCTKTILTQRWAHLGYSDNAGIESDEAFKEPDRAATISAFERTITEALLADPMGRTIQVKDFAFNWQADSLYITCTVIGQQGNIAVVNVALKI
jgi:hypothetical protein